MIEQVKQLRVEIDGLAQLCEGLKPITKPIGGLDRYEYEEMIVNSEEIKEAVKSLKLSKAWLGKVLEHLGSETPYVSGYKTVEDMEPTADKAEIVCGCVGVDQVNDRDTSKDAFTVAGKLVVENYGTHIEKVDWLRTEIKSLIQKLHHNNPKGYYDRALWKAEEYLCEARFWLGFELGRVRDESK